jgi:hypothetical protein
MDITPVEQSAFQQVANDVFQSSNLRTVNTGMPLRFSGNMKALQTEHPEVYESVMKYLMNNILHDIGEQQRRLKETMKEFR